MNEIDYLRGIYNRQGETNERLARIEEAAGQHRKELDDHEQRLRTAEGRQQKLTIAATLAGLPIIGSLFGGH